MEYEKIQTLLSWDRIRLEDRLYEERTYVTDEGEIIIAGHVEVGDFMHEVEITEMLDPWFDREDIEVSIL